MKHYSRELLFLTRKKSLLLVVLLSSSNIYAIDYLKYDFRDKNATVNFSSYIDAKSDNLPFNIFDQKWENHKFHKKENNAFGNMYADIFINLDTYRVGLFREYIAHIDVNDGFMNTWQAVQKNFFTLLTKKDINQDLKQTEITGHANYATTYGIYLQKVFRLNQSNFLSIKTKLNYADELQYMQANGTTSSEQFKGSFDYYYSNKNLVTKYNTKNKTPLGIGYGLNIEYIYNNQNIYFYFGVYNLASYIYWKNITLMHYDFNSHVIYKGKDGYNHYRPFGSGFYKYDLTFIQKLPQYYKASFNYELNEYIALGNNLEIYQNMYDTKPYINIKIHNNRYKLGYNIENSEAIFGAYFKYFNFEVSNYFGPSNDIMKASLNIWF